MAQTYAFNTLNESQPSMPRERARMNSGILKIGLNMNYLDIPNSSARLGFSIGLAPAFTVDRNFYFKPEMSFSLKGGGSSYQDYFYEGDVTYRLSYLEFPMMFGIRPSRHIAFEFGGYGAFLLGGSFAFNGTFYSGYGVFDSNELNNFDYGLAGGVVLSGRWLKVGIRYYKGLQQVSSMSSSQTFLGNATNHTIQIYFQRASLRERRREEM